PITGGNVSFYNETLGKPIYPTPVLGVLGLMEDADFAVGSGFQHEGDLILLLDGASPESAHSGDHSASAFSSSEYAKTTKGIVAGTPPAIDLAAERRLIDALVNLAAERAISSAHDVGDGGLAVTIAESCFADDGLSAEIDLGTSTAASEAALFGERGARAVVSVAHASLARVQQIAAQYNIQASQIGRVTRGEFRIQLNGVVVIQGQSDSFRRAWSESLPHAIESAS
ncbi:MAG TPA: AIR synthase-related protein, partial [Candidatus Acidoferrales bacterium]|nr:AIR synthase-related protein [Candidatus Acidoferrales bacterium]